MDNNKSLIQSHLGGLLGFLNRKKLNVGMAKNGTYIVYKEKTTQYTYFITFKVIEHLVSANETTQEILVVIIHEKNLKEFAYFPFVGFDETFDFVKHRLNHLLKTGVANISISI